MTSGKRLMGKIALVTGAGCSGPGWGNGRAIAVIFASEGATVFAVDRRMGSLEETLARAGKAGGAVEPFIADVSDPEQVGQMTGACLERHGRIDILVNNVGGSSPGGASELALEDWQRQLNANLTTGFLTMKAVVPIMKDQGGGAIVNIASTSGLRWTGSAQVGYAAAKAGVIQMSKVSAVQYAPFGIRVNTVIPGLLHTPMVEARLARQRTDGDVDALLEARQRRIPLNFMGDGRDTAFAALYLASDEARFVTGAEIVVDGGMVARCD